MRSSRFARGARVLALAAVGATPLACGAEPTPPPDAPDPVPVLDIATACAEYVAAYETAALCRSVDIVPPGHEPVPPAQLRIRKLFEERCRTWLGAPGSGITPARLHACSTRVRAQCVGGGIHLADAERYPSQVQFSWAPAVWSYYCDLDVPGTLPDGAPCGDSTQCAGGLCYRQPPAWACGTCASRAAVGELCLPYGCARGAVCEYCKFESYPPLPPAPPAPSCPGRRCLADVSGGVEGQPCLFFGCAKGLVCDHAGTGRCTPPRPPGAPCTSHDACVFRLCSQGVCADQRAEGGPCNSHWSCRPGLVCDLDRGCVTATAPTPAPKLPLGGKCGYDHECAPGNRCVNHTCVPPARLGEACRGPGDCEDDPFVECIAGTCQLYDPGACSASLRGIADEAPRTIPSGILAPPGRP
ncbi:MAG TPA: hypothetical protein PLR99_11590 [Polyangiaceae bacterium]|nr:hypothetical protein [Polyangiaceae bacterium]